MRDEALTRGGIPMSKMEVRAASLAYLDLYEALALLDIGAGTGSVGIEAARRHPNLKVTAIEREPEGCQLIRTNAEKFGCRLEIIEAEAPFSPPPAQLFDRIFIGGSGTQLQAILDWLKAGLMADGSIVVVNAIAIESLGNTLKALEDSGFTEIEGSMIQASRLDNLGKYHYFKPLNPCYVIKAIWRKTCQSLSE